MRFLLAIILAVTENALRVQDNKPVLKLERRILDDWKLFCFFEIGRKSRPSTKFQNIAKDRKIPCLLGEYLYMFVFLGCSCERSTVEEVESLDCFEGIDSVFEVIFGERS